MTDDTSRLKVARIVDRYDLADLDSQLRTRYVVEDASLRDLADFVNVQVTTAFLEDQPFAPESVYRILGDPEGSASKGDQSDLRRRLRAHGVDVEALEREWVTHMTVRSYLRRHLDVDTERDAQAPVDPAVTLERVRGLLDREESILRRSVEATASIDADRWDIHQQVRLIDRETGESRDLQTFLQDLADAENGAERPEER